VDGAHHHPKTDIVVTIVRIVPIARNGGGIVIREVPRAAPQDETGPPGPLLPAGNE
jgi:hypothetical protein